MLSISGGGIRGIVPLVLLREVERRLKGYKISERCDLIAGTSTGGIIACLLNKTGIDDAPRYSAAAVLRLYKKFGKTVFHRSLLRKILTLNGLIWNKYSEKPLEKLLKEYFGSDKLDKTVTEMIIPTYQISGRPYPHFFKTKYAKQPLEPLENPYIWEVARATSAANSYFKPYKLGTAMTLLDGGVFANNPAMCAYAEAKRLWPDEEITVISIGTGENLIGYPFEKIKNWGLIRWAAPFFEQTSISADATVDYILKTFSGEKGGDKYLCLQPNVGKSCMKMDNASEENLAALEQFAVDFIAKNGWLIDEVCGALLQEKKLNCYT